MRLALFALVFLASNASAQVTQPPAAGSAATNIRDGSATTDANGNATVTFSPAFSSTPFVVLSAIGTTTLSCQLTGAATTTGFTANCATIVSAGLGGASTRTNASGAVFHWHAAN